jgi:hypothetical protein
MPVEAFNWMGRVKAVEREYRAIRFGTDRLIASVNDAPSILEGHWDRPDIHTAAAKLEGTYVIRIFAEFETALQQFIRTFHLRRPGSTEALINRVRDRGRIPQPYADAVHRIRDHRNALVHDRLQPVDPVTIREATRAICTFLSRLDRLW